MHLPTNFPAYSVIVLCCLVRWEYERDTMNDDNYTIEEVATLLKVEHRAVRALINKGELGFFKVGRLYRIPKTAYEEYRTSKKKTPAVKRESPKPKKVQPDYFKFLKPPS